MAVTNITAEVCFSFHGVYISLRMFYFQHYLRLRRTVHHNYYCELAYIILLYV